MKVKMLLTVDYDPKNMQAITSSKDAAVIKKSVVEGLDLLVRDAIADSILFNVDVVSFEVAE